MTFTPWLTLLLFSVRLGVVLLLFTEGSLIAWGHWKKKRQRTKAYSKPHIFSKFMEEWANKGVK